MRILAKKSRYRGVSFHNRKGKWTASIECQGVIYYCGQYDQEIDAARAYDRKALELLGDNAKTNVRLGILNP